MIQNYHFEFKNTVPAPELCSLVDSTLSNLMVLAPDGTHAELLIEKCMNGFSCALDLEDSVHPHFVARTFGESPEAALAELERKMEERRPQWTHSLTFADQVAVPGRDLRH